MAQKKKPVKKGKKRPSLFKEVVGILVIMIGVLVFFAIFFETSTGVFGKVTSNLLSGLLGWTYKLFPFLIVLLGIFLIFTSYEINWERRSGLILLSLLLISCFFQLTYIDKWGNVFKDDSFFRKFEHFYVSGNQGELTGGVFGGILTNPLIAIFGITGTYVILIGIALIFVILITNSSFKEFFIHIRNGIKGLFKWMMDSFKPIEDQPKPKKKRIRNQPEPEIIEEEYGQQRIIPSKRKKIDFTVDDSDKKADLSILGKDSDEPDEQPERKPRRTKAVRAREKSETVKETLKTEKIVKETTPRVTSRGYIFPPLNLLDDLSYDDEYGDNCDQISDLLEETLGSFGVEAKVVSYSKGPTVTRYELQPKSGVKVSKITNLADDIALNLAARDVRIEAPVPGKAVVGIEVPNKGKVDCFT